jgi:Kef-type K+ transport system membrane component KefB
VPVDLNGLEIVGGAILAGFAAGRVFGLLSVPAVAGYVVLGVILSESFTGAITHEALDGLHVISELALGAIAFTIGSELQWRTLRKIGRAVFPIVMLEALGAMVLVTAGVWLLFDDPPLALLLAVVGIDDAIALIVYAAAAAAARTMLIGSDTLSMAHVLGAAGYEIGGSMVLGALAGGPLGLLVARLKSREAVLSLAVGALILIEGICDQYQLSSLLAAMTLGAMVANIAPFPSRNLSEQIASMAAPILIGFFVLAGAHLRADLLPSLGWLGVLYLGARFAGKLGGAWLGATIGGAPSRVRSNIGYGLLSQVGIAIGLSLVVAADFTPLGEAGKTLALTVVNILLGTTLVTEVVGPVLARRALVRAGEAGMMNKEEVSE